MGNGKGWENRSARLIVGCGSLHQHDAGRSRVECRLHRDGRVNPGHERHRQSQSADIHSPSLLKPPDKVRGGCSRWTTTPPVAISRARHRCPRRPTSPATPTLAGCPSPERATAPGRSRRQNRRSRSTAWRASPDRLAVGETVVVLHPPLPLVGVSIMMKRRCQQNDNLADG